VAKRRSKTTVVFAGRKSFWKAAGTTRRPTGLPARPAQTYRQAVKVIICTAKKPVPGKKRFLRIK
jgi:hypothetical protein